MEGGCVLVGDGEDCVTVCVLLGGRSRNRQGLRLKLSVGTEQHPGLLSSGNLSDVSSG